MAAVDASPRPERVDPNSESRNPPSTPQQSSSSSENPNLNSLPNPSPSGSLNNPSTPVQSATTPIAPSYASPYLPRGAPQFVNPNPSFQMSQAAALQPPGVGSPAIAGSPVASSVRPVGMYQSVPGQPQVQFQYGQVQNGYMAAGAIPPPGVPRYPGQYAGLIRPGFTPRPMLRPTIPGIRPGPTPPIMTPLMRPITPIPLVEKPQTTVYVGKIAPTVDNDFLLTLLKLCGPVKSWKRAQDPSDGKPKGFGFCEFEAAEGVLRALRLLSKLNLDGQELVLNINQATRDYLEKYVEKKTEREKVKESEESGQTTTEESKKESQEDSSSKEEDKDAKDEARRFGIVNEEDKNADKEAVDKINSMLEERVTILPPPPPLPTNNAESANNLGKNQNESLVNPSRFKDGDSDLELKRSGEKNSEDNEVEASSARSRRERSRERERERNTRDKEREADRYERERERDRMKRDREREDRVRQTDRVLKDKLKDWENREREKEYQRHHERDREKERERERKRELLKQEEEYEDENNINVNESRKRRRNNRGGFNNNNVEERKRKRQREKEREEDVSDRLKEEEEREEEIKREKELERERLLREEEREKEREKEKENEEQIKREMYVKDIMYGPKLVDERESVERETLHPMQIDIDKDNNYNNDYNNNSNGEIKELGQENIDNNNINAPKKLGFGLFGSGKKTSVPSVFKQEEDEEQEDKKMRPLVPIDYSAEELQAISQNNNDINNKEGDKNNNNVGASEYAKKDKRETKKVLDAKQLIDMIPKTKEELFSYEINWTIYDKHELNERMRPWISKKIMEFLGEEEETLVDYIVSCTKDHVEASKLLELLQAILDEEAEMFVLKMWRMLIFEIKKVETGLVKIK